MMKGYARRGGIYSYCKVNNSKIEALTKKHKINVPLSPSQELRVYREIAQVSPDNYHFCAELQI